MSYRVTKSQAQGKVDIVEVEIRGNEKVTTERTADQVEMKGIFEREIESLTAEVANLNVKIADYQVALDEINAIVPDPEEPAP